MAHKHTKTISHPVTANSQRLAQRKKSNGSSKKKDGCSTLTSKSSCYERKPIKFLKDNKLFKTSKRSNVWWKVQSQTTGGKWNTIATSMSSQRTQKFSKKKRYVFTKRYETAIS